MSAQLNLKICLPTGSTTSAKFQDVDLRKKVEDLRLTAAEQLAMPKDSFELIYCGSVLEDDASLESCGLRDGSCIYVLKRKEPEKPVPAKAISEASILQVATAFRSFNENSALRSALHRLSKRPEVIENIILTSPGLIEDSVAIAMLQDPDLMAHFNDPDTVKRAAELHPSLVEAAQLIIAAVHEEAYSSTSGSSRLNAPSTAYSYSLDNLSDDEEMAGDSSQSSDSNTAITTAQLAAALSRASARAGFPLSHSSSSTSAGSNSGVITTEMFSHAMQQAFAAAPSNTGSTSAAQPPTTNPAVPQPGDLQRQLAQMHEMGLQDDAVNVTALQFTNGDVQAAIELVFSGFSDN